MRLPPASTTLTEPSAISSPCATVTSCGMRRLRSEAADVGRDHLLQRLGQTLIAGLCENVLEKTFGDDLRGSLRADAAALQVEQLFFVDRPDRGAVRAARDVIDEDR